MSDRGWRDGIMALKACMTGYGRLMYEHPGAYYDMNGNKKRGHGCFWGDCIVDWIMFSSLVLRINEVMKSD